MTALTGEELVAWVEKTSAGWRALLSNILKRCRCPAMCVKHTPSLSCCSTSSRWSSGTPSG